jgi:acyl-CoA thioesterase I
MLDCPRGDRDATIRPMIRRGKGLAVAVLLLIGVAANAEVINRGFPGANTVELEARFNSVLMLHPKIVVLMGGANDALNPAKLLPAEVSRERIQAMVTRARASGVLLVLVTVHAPDLGRLLARHAPAEYGDLPPQKRISALNQALREVASKNGIPLVDFQAVMEANGGSTPRLSTDGLHLTRSGYALLASAVCARLPPHITASDTIVCFGDSLTYGIGVRAPGDAPEATDTYPAQLRALVGR